MSEPTVRALIAEAEKRGAVEALRAMAQELREDAAEAWGGEAMWLSTGTKVAALCAEWVTARAERVAADIDRGAR